MGLGSIKVQSDYLQVLNFLLRFKRPLASAAALSISAHESLMVL